MPTSPYNIASAPTSSLMAEIERRKNMVEDAPYWALPVLREVAGTFGLPIEELVCSRSHAATYIWPRSIAMYLLRERTGQTFESISAVWGLSLSTSYNAEKRIRLRVQKDKAFARKIAPLFMSVKAQLPPRSGSQNKQDASGG